MDTIILLDVDQSSQLWSQGGPLQELFIQFEKKTLGLVDVCSKSTDSH